MVKTGHHHHHHHHRSGPRDPTHQTFRSPELWHPKRKIITTDAETDEDITTYECPAGTHLTSARRYRKHPGGKKTPCLTDCRDWVPPRKKGPKGQCLRPKSAWLKGLLQYWQDKRKTQPDFPYGKAMHEYSDIYHKRA